MVNKTNIGFLVLLVLMTFLVSLKTAFLKNNVEVKKTGFTLEKSKDSLKGTVPAGGIDIVVGKWTMMAGDEDVHDISELCFGLKVQDGVLKKQHFSGAAKIRLEDVVLYSTVINDANLSGGCTYSHFSVPFELPAKKTRPIELLISLDQKTPHGARFTPVLGIKKATPKTVSANILAVSAMSLNRAVNSPTGNVPAGGSKILVGKWTAQAIGSEVKDIKRFCLDLNPYAGNSEKLTSKALAGKAYIFADNLEIMNFDLKDGHLDRKCDYAALPTPFTLSTGTTMQFDVKLDIGPKVPHGIFFSPLFGLEGSFPTSLAANPVMMSGLTLKKSPASRGGSVSINQANVSVGEWTLSAADSKIKEIPYACFELKTADSAIPLVPNFFSGTAKMLIDGITVGSFSIGEKNFDGICDYVKFDTPLAIDANASKRIELVVTFSKNALTNAEFIPMLGIKGAVPDKADGNQIVINGLTLQKSKNSPSDDIIAGGVEIPIGEWELKSAQKDVFQIQKICFDLNPGKTIALTSAYFLGDIKIIFNNTVIASFEVNDSYFDGECKYQALQTFFDLEHGSPKNISVAISLAPNAPAKSSITPILGVEGATPATVSANKLVVK